MAKRKKKKEEEAQAQAKAKKEETKSGDDVAKDEEKPTVVNPDYDAMPDTIEDPGNTYRMALLDTQAASLQYKRNYLELSYNLQISNTQKKMVNELREIDAEIKDVQRQYKDQKDHIEAKYNIALKSYNYNDETGTLTKQVLTQEE